MAKLRKPSVAPLYMAAAVWILAGLFGSMYQLSTLASVAGGSILVFFLGRKLYPGTEIEIPDPPVTTGDEELDELVRQKDGAMAQLRGLNDAIAEPAISAQIDALERLTGRIIGEVLKQPVKRGQIHRFMDYYLPTTLKILRVYTQMDDLSGSNIDATKQKIESMMHTIVQAFQAQLDALFADVSLDIAADIQVMEQLIAQEGLGKQQLLGGT
jgi:hypothetical protein